MSIHITIDTSKPLTPQDIKIIDALAEALKQKPTVLEDKPKPRFTPVPEPTIDDRAVAFIKNYGKLRPSFKYSLKAMLEYEEPITTEQLASLLGKSTAAIRTINTQLQALGLASKAYTSDDMPGRNPYVYSVTPLGKAVLACQIS